MFLYLLLKITLRGSIVNSKNLVFPDSFSSRIYTMSIVFIKYIYLLIFPSKLIAFYDTAIIKIVSQINVEVTLALILIFGLLITGFILLWHQRFIAFSILFFFGTMSVVSNVFFDIGVIMAERFLYFPSISICLIFGAIFYWLINHSSKLKTIGTCLFTLVCLLAPQDKEISLAYALVLLNSGIIEDAKLELESLIKQNPNLIEAHNYLGIVYLNLQLYAQAQKQFEITLKINPNYKPAEINLLKLKEITSNRK